jgi:hypothetical protein
VADPSTGVAVYDTYTPYSGVPYNWILVGGTSASSPFVAGLYARGGHLSQVIGPNTGKDWDGPTGVGVPNGLAGL